MARRKRLTARAKQSRRRRVVCGHFRTREMTVRSAQGVTIVSICTQCHKPKSSRPMTRQEKLDIVKAARILKVIP